MSDPTVNNTHTLVWTAHPVRHRPLRGLLVFGVLLVVEYSVAVGWEAPVLAVVCAFGILGATASFLFPTHYRLDAEGVEIRFLGTRRTRPWNQLRRYREAREGVLVTPFRKPSLLDGPRGLFLTFDEGTENRKAVMDAVERFIPRSRAA